MNLGRWRNYGLWVSIAAFVPLLLTSFGVEIFPNYQQVISALLGILVTAGILNNPTTQNKWFLDDTEEDNKDKTL